MELRLLSTFVAVAELRHFARAADRCNLSQPAVSHQIRVLEDALHTRLLNRSGRRVSLTVAGELLLEDARRILSSVDRARERVENLSSGTVGRVRLGATETAGLYRLPAILARYRQAHPQFALQFAIAPELDILERVAANDLDMGVVTGKPRLGELRGRRIDRDELVIVAGASSALAAKKRRVKASDLRDQPWILREEGSDTRRQLDAWLRRQRITPAQVMTLHGPDAVKRGAIAGYGLGLLAGAAAADALAAGNLVALSLSAPVPARDVLVVDHPHKHHGAACTAMLTMLTAR